MENRNLEKALDIVSLLVSGQDVGETSANSALYQEYSNNSEVYAIVQETLRHLELEIYEYKNSLYTAGKAGNTVFGFTNEEVKKALGIKLNKELYLAYFIIYNIIMQFYTDSSTPAYVEYVKIDDIVNSMDTNINGIIDDEMGIVLDEIEENSFRQIALSWEELPASSSNSIDNTRAARKSKAGFVKTVINFLEENDLLIGNDARYYPTDRFRSMIENYYEDNRSRLAQLLKGKKEQEK